tara:strand:- start:141 stop:608 length:468 start_codon:yes stop_codon:yes gene_type:complete
MATGEFYEDVKIIEYPEQVCFKYDFVKQNGQRIVKLSKSLIGHLAVLSNYLEYGTNRLTISGMGKRLKVMNDEHISRELNISTKQGNRIITKLIDAKALFFFNEEYYINPTFYLYGASFDSEHLEEMMEQDPEILCHIEGYHKAEINMFKKVAYM